MSTTDRAPAFSILAPPYRTLFPVADPGELVGARKLFRGVALVWHLERGDWGRGYRAIRDRPGGVSLIVVLPPPDRLGDVDELLQMTDQCRPHTLLPFHPDPDPEELTVLLRRAPSEWTSEVLDYLAWRGIRTDRDTRALLAKTIELSEQLKTVSGLARSLYLSRRALGRRFRNSGVPVPSHWLHVMRILRASVELQNSEKNLFRIACDLGYPDGFSLSNQMKRLTGVRPSEARRHLGWEWILEAWLRQESRTGGLAIPLGSPAPPRSRPDAGGPRRRKGTGAIPDGRGPGSAWTP